VRERAEQAVTAGTVRLRQWWTGKYRLPANHELFLSRTVSDLQQEQLEDVLQERQDLLAALEDSSLSAGARARVSSRLTALSRALGLQTGDDLVEFWDAEARAGRVPDLDMTVEDLARLRGTA
jgi:hypothetical protein